MKPARFDYHRPDTVEEAAALLADLGDEAKIIAGGQSLIPMLALRLAAFDHLVDVGRLERMSGIKRDGTKMWVGAGTTQAAIGQSCGAVPLLVRATPLIGHFQIRNRGTLGGSIAHADAAAEYPAVALTLDAEITAVSPRGERSIPAAEFFTGMWTTALAADEVLTGVTFPLWHGRAGFAIEEFARRHGDFAIAGATVAVELDTADRIARCAIGLFGLGPKPERAWALETKLTGAPIPEEIGPAAVADLSSVPADLHGSADYRKRVGAAMVQRAWQRAVKEALDG